LPRDGRMRGAPLPVEHGGTGDNDPEAFSSEGLSLAAMAFPLFPKFPGKDKQAGARTKPELAPRHDARPADMAGPVSAREVAAAAKGRPPPAVKLRASAAAVAARERDLTVTGPPAVR